MPDPTTDLEMGRTNAGRRTASRHRTTARQTSRAGAARGLGGTDTGPNTGRQSLESFCALLGGRIEQYASEHNLAPTQVLQQIKASCGANWR